MTRGNMNLVVSERSERKSGGVNGGRVKRVKRRRLRSTLPPGLGWVGLVPWKWMIGFIVIAVVAFSVVPGIPKAVMSGLSASATTLIEGWFGDESVTTEQVEQVLYGNLERGQAIGIAMREIELRNQTVRFNNTDFAGLGRESLTGSGTVVVLAQVTLEGSRVEQTDTGFVVRLQPASVQGLYFPAKPEDGFPVLTQRSRNIVTRIGDAFRSVTPELPLYEAMVSSAEPMAEQDRSLLAAAEAAAAANIEQLLEQTQIDLEVIFSR